MKNLCFSFSKMMVFILIIAIFSLIPTSSFASDNDNGILQIRNHFDFLQPVQVGRETDLLGVGYHVTFLQVERFTFGGFGVALGGAWDDDVAGAKASLMLKVPIANMKIVGEYDDPDKVALEFGSGAIYNATTDRWGVSFLFSIGW